MPPCGCPVARPGAELVLISFIDRNPRLPSHNNGIADFYALRCTVFPAVRLLSRTHQLFKTLRESSGKKIIQINNINTEL